MVVLERVVTLISSALHAVYWSELQSISSLIPSASPERDWDARTLLNLTPPRGAAKRGLAQH